MPAGIIASLFGNAIGAGIAAGVLEFLGELVRPAVRGAGTLTRAEIWIRTGHCTRLTAKLFDSITSYDPHHSAGMSTHGILKVFEEFVRAVAWASTVLTEEIAEELYTELLQEGLSQAIQTSLGGAVSTILNYWRGGQPIYPDEIEDVGESIEDLDVDSATLLAGMAGCNLPATHFKLKRGLDRMIEGKLTQLRPQLRGLGERINDAVLWLAERAYYRALREWDDALSAVEAAIYRAITLYDHVCERALSRIQEIRSEVETLKAWWEYTQAHPDTPLIDEATAEITLTEDEAEVDAILETAERILGYIDDSASNLEYSLTDIKRKVDNVMKKYVGVLNEMVSAGEIDVSEAINRIEEVMFKLSAIRNKTDTVTSPVKPFRSNYHVEE